MTIRTLGRALAAQFEAEHAVPALEHRGRTIDYTELAFAAYAIADELARLNVKKGAHVGVLVEDGSVIVPAVIGILARGCVFALLDPAHPPSHLRELADASDLTCLFVEDTLFSIAAEALSNRPVSIRPISAQIFATAGSCGSLTTELADTAERALYLYFSSGTSGKQKPILGRADSLLHFLDWEIATLGLDATVRVSQLTSPSHDPYLRDVFTPLVAGGTVCLPDSRHVVLSPFELARWIDHAQIEVVHCTPTVFRNLCNGGLVGRSFERLTHVLIAGEQLRGKHLVAWYEAIGDRVQLVNLYGPTETTLAKLYYFISPSDVDRAAIPIGQPINGTQLRIMATSSEECVTGEIGELYIETASGTLGYYRQPLLNRDVFEPDPAESLNSPVTYKTGDLVRRLDDGNIEFVGRRDRRQKVRGKHTDLGQVEDEIIKRSDVASCVVNVVTDAEGGGPDRLVAYYVARDELRLASLEQQLARDLPASMIPDVWIRVDSLPTNVNGKVDDAELAALFSVSQSMRSDEGGQDAATERGIEDRLLALWKELLRNDSIGLDDPFMEVGGDSLSIMLLIARLDEEFGYNLALWQVFEQLTIRSLSGLITGTTVAAPGMGALKGTVSHADNRDDFGR
ncbi:MAG TPA: non-ribosomal peptide synthetase [Vicinamibacterales bacterium]|nr:non-ribosomal peptide synthetase [Vicinamibacterales bacterium]